MATDRRLLLVNEDGKQQMLARNSLASDIYAGWPDFVVGDVLVISKMEEIE